jgi:glycosyltransferase involved in cell wall biosynthesis
MTVLQILYSGLGGHGSVAYSLYEGDVENKTAQSFLYYGIEDLNDDYIERNKDAGITFEFIKKKKGVDLLSWKKIFHYLKERQPDIILLHSITLIIPALAFCLIYRKKTITIEHNANNIKRPSEWLWSAITILFSRKTVYLTEKYRSEVKKKLGPLFISNKSIVIGNGINLERFYCPIADHLKGYFTLFMQSRFTHFRDHKTLLYCIRKLKPDIPEIQLVLAGDGETLAQMKDLAAQLNISTMIKFTGNIQEDEIIAQLRKSSIYVHASLAETMSTAIMQAMACGLPIVASDICGINNMLADGRTALLFQPKNVTVLCDKILYLYKNRNIADQMGANARKYAELKLSNKRMFNEYYCLFST